MSTRVIDLYRKNIKYFLVLALVELVVISLVAKLFFPNISLTITLNMIINNNNIVELFVDHVNGLFIFIVIMIVLFLVLTLFESILLLFNKTIIDNKEIDIKSIIKVALHKYKDIVRVNLLIALIGIILALAIVLSSFLKIIGIIITIVVVIYAIYFAITVKPATSYLVTMNKGIMDSFTEGRNIGKKYFWTIFLLTIIPGLVKLLFKLDIINLSLILSMIVAYAVFIAESFVYLYLMVIVDDYMK